jgi:hypothetical protein
MEAALSDLEPLLIALADDSIDKAVLVIDPARPPASPIFA